MSLRFFIQGFVRRPLPDNFRELPNVGLDVPCEHGAGLDVIHGLVNYGALVYDREGARFEARQPRR